MSTETETKTEETATSLVGGAEDETKTDEEVIGRFDYFKPVNTRAEHDESYKPEYHKKQFC